MSEGASPAPAAATPSPAATSEAPAAQPEAQGTPENPVVHKEIKPIPPRRVKFEKGELPSVSPDGEKIPEDYVPRLPGVFTDDTGADAIPSLRKRDPQTGKFVKADRPDMPEGEPAPDAGPTDEPKQPDLPGEPPAPKQKVKFLGKEYDSIEAVENSHRTLQGMYRQELDNKRRLTEERDYGYRAGNAWKAEYDRVVAELEQLRGGGGGHAPAAQARQPEGRVATQPQGGVDFDVDAVVNGIDMKAFEMIAAHPQGGLPQAGKYLVSETLAAIQKHLVPQLLAQLDRRVQPFEEETSSRQAQAGQLQAFELVADMKTVDGEMAFPELSDERAIEDIGELFGRTRKRNFETAQDIIEGIAMYRMMKGFNGPRATAPQPAPSPAPGAAASVEADPTGGMPPNGGRLQGSPAERRLIASLDKVDLVDPILGFRRNY